MPSASIHAAAPNTLAALLALVTLAGAAPAGAQYDFGTRPARATLGGGVLVAQPVGEFKSYVNNGFGGGGHLMLRIDPRGFLAVRADVGYLVYGHETKRVSLPNAGRVQFDVTTSNNILMYSVGPQLMVPSGPIRPYVNAVAGGAYFFTESSIGGSDNAGDYASTRNFGDNVPSYGYGGGLFVPLAVRNALIGIDIGARFIRNGHTRYLREGGIQDDPAGGYTVSPIESETNLVVYHVGISAGLRSRRPR
ncbi:MAG: hypothetical protein ABR499_19690 [Gemmatimonadaceae bacterium]